MNIHKFTKRLTIQLLSRIGKWYAGDRLWRSEGTTDDLKIFYGRIEYPQTWNVVVHFLPRWIQLIVEFLCEVLIGHEPSKTERGYDGSGYVDYWCRWCDKRMRGRVEEDPIGLELKKDFEGMNKGNDWKGQIGATGVTSGKD